MENNKTVAKAAGERLLKAAAIIVAPPAGERLLEKRAGYWSELVGGVANPLNWYGGNLVGPAVALARPTRTLEQQAEHDAGGIGQILANLLIPGVAPYHASKRIGFSIRSKELKDEKSRIRAKKLKAKSKNDDDEEETESKSK